MPTHFTIEKLAAYLEAESIEFIRDDDEQTVVFGIEGDNGEFDVFFDLNDTEGYLLCAVRPPVEFTPEQRPLIYEAVSHANHLLSLGAFQVNTDEGGLLFVLGIPIEDADLSSAQLEIMLAACLECADMYEPAFQKILGGADIMASIQEAETPPAE